MFKRKRPRARLVLATLIIAPLAPLFAVQEPAIRGPFGVGFRVRYEHDYARTVGPARDFEGRERPGETAHPVQIRIWYPARPAAGRRPLTLGDYLLLGATRGGDRPVSEPDRARAIEEIRGFGQFGMGRELSTAQASELFARPVLAVGDAAPAPGRFPVIVAGTDGGTAGAASLFETLASHGYVVVATAAAPALGALQVTAPARVIEARIDDLGFLAALARGLPFADLDRLALFGVNFDGMTAVLAQMRDMRAAAVVSIDGWEGKRGSVATVRSSIHFDPLRMRVPYLLALQDERNPPPNLTLDYAIPDALKYADAEVLVVRDLNHALLVGIGPYFPDLGPVRTAGHALLTRRVLGFLDRHLKGDAATPAPPADSLARVDRRRRALSPLPYAEELERLVMGERGAERLRELFRRARGEDSTAVFFSQQALNLFAFRFSRSQRLPEAVMLLELGAEAAPGSIGAHNDLGNLLLQTGDTARAVAAFRRALAVLPTDTSMSEADRAQSRTVLEQKIARVTGPPAPAPAYSVGMALDPGRSRLVVFGGFFRGGYVGDTWEWDGGRWSRFAGAGPSARNNPAMVYDAARRQIVLFGGDTRATGPLGDTWVFDGSAWRQVASTGPSPRTGHQMVYDAGRQRVVLFGGGAGGPETLGDTWEWDGERWTERATGGPAPRALFGLGYDDARRRVVLFGGAPRLAPDTPSLGDTWEWDGSAWRQVATGGPSPRDHVAMDYDPARRAVVLHGGGPISGDAAETWTFDGRDWTRLGAAGPPRRYARLAFDPRAAAMLLYGGFDTEPRNELWRLAGSSWARAFP